MVRRTARDRYDEMFEDFKRYICSDESRIVDWRPGTRNELIVYMNTGDIISYDNLNKRSEYITNYDVKNDGGYTLDDEMYKRAFSQKFRRLMRGAHMSQKQLSDVTGISAVTLSHYMNGRNLPDIRNAYRICRALECSFYELMEVD